MTGMSQPQVVQLLRRALGNVTLLVSRQETIDAQEEEEVRACLTNSCTFCIVISGPPPHFSSPLSPPLPPLLSLSFPISFHSQFPSSAEPSLPTTVDKTVMTYEIPLYNSGPAGLGVTVYGRTSLNTTKRQGDMGIYIKSIVPGGAAALVRSSD